MNHPQHSVPCSLAALVGAAILLTAPATTAQGDAPFWPQWRGPNLDGISAETGWEVGETSSTLWSKDLGIGYSCVTIQDGRLFTMGHDKEAQEDTIFCLDPETGEEIWSHTFDAPTMAKAHGGGSLSTPSIDGELLFASNRMGNFFCFEAKSGELRWSKNLVDEFGVKVPTWGFAAAPLVLEEAIVMNVGRVLAFDRSGELRWKTDDYGDCYSTPAPFEHDGKSRFAVFNAKGLAVIDRETGKEIATAEWKTSYDVNAATPVVIGNRIFVSSGYNRGCGMFEFDGETLTELWSSKVMRNHMSGCVYWRDHLFGYDEGSFKCLDLDGEVKWSERGLGKCAFMIADGKLLLLGRRGDLVIAEATPEEYREIARTSVLGRDGQKWTVPVLCGGLIYCRSSSGEFVCVDARRTVR